MSQQQCALKDCKRASRTLCQCCNQNLCRDHFIEHDDLLNSQLNPLTDEINSLSDRLSAIRIDRLTSDSRKKLDQWRLECHQIIDQFYEQKCAELEYLVRGSIDEQRQEITKIRSKVTELIEKQETSKGDIESVTKGVRSLQQKLNDIENIHVHIDVRAIKIDNSCITIGKKEEKKIVLDLTHLPPAYHTINLSSSSQNALASNDQVLLAHLNSNLCLFDKNLKIIAREEFELDIDDICWSSALNHFIFTAENNIYSFNENDRLIKRVKGIEEDCWWVCGCSTKSLFLSRNSWDSSIWEFVLLPSIRFITQWNIDNGLKQNLRIDAINCSSEIVVLVINNQSTSEKLVQIRSLEIFSVLRSVKLNVNYNNFIVRCSMLNDNQWLLTDWDTSQLFHINRKGDMLGTSTYPTTPYNVNIFRSKTLVVLTRGQINFHTLDLPS